MRKVTAPLIAGALLMAGCGSSLKADDPAGYEACQLYAKATKVTNDPLRRMGLLFDVGDLASKAATPAIRDSAAPMFDEEAADVLRRGGQDVPETKLVDDKALTAACEASGVDIP